MSEPILSDTNNRFTFFPIQYPELYALYKKQLACFWTTDELDISKDREVFETLTKNEQYFIKHILAFFAASDGIVMENICGSFLDEVKISEARACYSIQNFMEQIHSETYSLLIDTIVRNPTEKEELFNAVCTYPAIELKANWALKWIGNKSRSYGSRLVAFMCVENIQFSGSFCSIFWLKKRGINMNGLIFSNELISRDEALHVETAVCLYHKLQKKPSNAKITEIIKEAVDIEKGFICEALPCRLLGMNDKLMSQYIEFVADRLCSQLHIKKIYNAANPFDFMEAISLERKTNFFESRVSEYALANKSDKNIEFGSDGF
jgi:ribonucleoside-diphosphate reductase subunit M2|tara:strand:+ start:1967 stop:2929 length:963 start_codon:yes stop_codon:yes gene_type:complete